MFEIKQGFIGIAYGNEITNQSLYWVLDNIFHKIINCYKAIQFNERALCKDLLSCIKICWFSTSLNLFEIEEELMSCIDKKVPLKELKFSVYEDTTFFDKLNQKFEDDTYIIKYNINKG